MLAGGILLTIGGTWTWDSISGASPELDFPGYVLLPRPPSGFGQLAVVVLGVATLSLAVSVLLDLRLRGVTVLIALMDLSALGVVLYHLATKSNAAARFLADLGIQGNARIGMGLYSTLIGVGLVLLGLLVRPLARSMSGSSSMLQDRDHPEMGTARD